MSSSFIPKTLHFPGGITDIEARGGRFCGGEHAYRTDAKDVRLDGLPVNSGQGTWLEREIVNLDDAVQQEVLPPDDSNLLVQSVQTDEPLLFRKLKYKRIEGSVLAQELAARSNDVNVVGINSQDYEVSVSRPASGIWLDDSEVRIAAASGLSLQSYQTGIVVESHVNFRRRMVFEGHKASGQLGFFADGVVKSDNRLIEIDVNTLTADQLYNLFIDAASMISVNSLDTVEPDSMLVPSILYARAAKLRMSESGLTVLQTFLLNSPWFNDLSQIMSSPFLNYRAEMIGSTERRVMSLITFRAGTSSIRIRQAGLRQLQPIRFLKGVLIAWEDGIGDVEIVRPGNFRITNFAGADPRTYVGD